MKVIEHYLKKRLHVEEKLLHILSSSICRNFIVPDTCSLDLCELATRFSVENGSESDECGRSREQRHN